MNKLKRAITILELCVVELTLAQDVSFIGNYNDELNAVRTVLLSNQVEREYPVLTLRLPNEKSFEGKVIYKTVAEHEVVVSGKLKEDEKSSFFISMKNHEVEGHIISEESTVAYHYYSLNEKVYVEKILKEEVLCTEYGIEKKAAKRTIRSKGDTTLIPILNSLPNANGIVLLDFDGQEVFGTRWLYGGYIKAESFDYSVEEIKLIWEIVKEDFLPLNINITTDEVEFNKYPKNKRIRCIITPTNVIAPQSGGIAYVNSFVWNDDTPCWVFVGWPENTGEIISHEIGHTLGLSHDGDYENEYYTGHGDWAPIMGKSYGKKLTQWSKGEYKNANNTEDDLERMAREFMGLGYLPDDHADFFSNSTPFKVAGNGSVYSDSNWGVISKANDKDYFSFVTSGGKVDVSVNVSSDYSNLRLRVTLFNALKEEVKEFKTNGLTVFISEFLNAGEYYVCVEGAGFGNVATGYSNYGSLGKYLITGSIPVSHYTLLPNDNTFWHLPLVIESQGSDSLHQFLGGINQEYISNLTTGEWFELFVEIKESGNYGVQTFLNKSNKGEFDIWIDNEKVIKDKYTNFSLDSGIHDVRFEVVMSGLKVDKIALLPVKVDCHQVVNGLAYIDNCGVCVEGDTHLKPCVNTLEVENGCVPTGGVIDSGIRGFSGTGYFNFSNELTSSSKWTFDVANEVTTNMIFRYANGSALSRNMSLIVNGEIVSELVFDATGNWWDWKNTSQLVGFQAGYNTVELISLTELGGPHLDWISFSEINIKSISCDDLELITCEDQNGDGFIDCAVTSHEAEYDLNLSIYPNPVVERLSIDQMEQKFISYQLTNTLGEVFFKDELKEKNVLEFSSLSKGIYVLQLFGESGVKQVSLIKQ